MVAQANAEASAVFQQRYAEAQAAASRATQDMTIVVSNDDFVEQKTAEINAVLDVLISQLKAKVATKKQDKQEEAQELIAKYVEDHKINQKDSLEKYNSLLKECLAKVDAESQKGNQADLSKVDTDINENLENFAQ